MIKNAKFILLMLLFLACSDETKNSQFQTDTNDASVLFFKNLRKSAYNVQEIKAAHLNIYIHKDTPEDAQLTIKLIHDWYNDKANVMLELNETTTPLTFLIGRDTVIFHGETINNHIEVARKLYDHQQGPSSARVWIDNQWSMVFPDNESSNSFVVTMKDFYNLVEFKN